MISERMQRQIDRLLDEAEEAVSKLDWGVVRDRARAVLGLDPANRHAVAYLDAAVRELGEAGGESETARSAQGPSTPGPASQQPTSFANGRYQVKEFLGEGGKKQVYRAHDSVLGRDVALAVIKTEGLDPTSRVRITREAQAMGRPNLEGKARTTAWHDSSDDHRRHGISGSCPK